MKISYFTTCVILAHKKHYLKKPKYKAQDNNQNIHKSKRCRAAEFSKLCKFSMDFKTGLESSVGCSLIGVLDSENPLILVDCKWVLYRFFFFPWEKEIVHRLSHISGVRKFKIIHNVFCNLRHHPHRSKLIKGNGNLHLVMFTDVSSHTGKK